MRFWQYLHSIYYISDHSDKTIDVDRNSKIVNFSVGATRVMILKKKKETKSDNSMNDVRHNQRYDLLNNSLFILGLRTNQFMYHTIRRDNRMQSLKRSDELMCEGQRISLTFRNICTFKSRKNILIGQGAKLPNRNCIVSVSHEEKMIVFEKEKVDFDQIAIEANDNQQSNAFKQMIYAFGDENMKARSFEWEKAYGDGFNIVL